MESAKVGKRGAIIVPARLRKRFGIEEGTLVTAEATEDGILIRPADCHSRRKIFTRAEGGVPAFQCCFCRRIIRRHVRKFKSSVSTRTLFPIGDLLSGPPISRRQRVVFGCLQDWSKAA